MSALRRTRIGEFKIEESLKIEQFLENIAERFSKNENLNNQQ
jgi:tRNA U55 pseudouridine synthase TruB